MQVPDRTSAEIEHLLPLAESGAGQRRLGELGPRLIAETRLELQALVEQRARSFGFALRERGGERGHVDGDGGGHADSACNLEAFCRHRRRRVVVAGHRVIHRRRTEPHRELRGDGSLTRYFDRAVHVQSSGA